MQFVNLLEIHSYGQAKFKICKENAGSLTQNKNKHSYGGGGHQENMPHILTFSIQAKIKINKLEQQTELLKYSFQGRPQR